MSRRIFAQVVTICLFTVWMIGPLSPKVAAPLDSQAATLLHVAVSGSDVTGTGSEANPFATIQHGIEMASNGDTVLVHPGIYRENVNFNGKNITVGSLFVITADKDYIQQTVIDGRHIDHVIALVSGETAAATLSGFTVINGFAHAANWPDNSGGGIVCVNSAPTLTYLKVVSNESVAEGGGLYFAHCAAVVHDVAVTHNQSGGGGGIRYSYGSVSLENAVIAHNLSQGGGAGIQFYHAEGTVKNALISDNSGGDKGGGLHFDGCSPTFQNVTIVGNWTAGHGGGLNVSYMSQPALVNSIVWGNAPEQIYYDTDWPGEAITIDYSDVQGGAAGIITNGHGPVYWGSGNLDASPRFVNASLNNYRLADNSPAISAGTTVGAPLTDLEGNLRPCPAGTKPDLGAYESPIGHAHRSTHLPLVFNMCPPVIRPR
ncbi:MAG: choice-of-anchor Q domain-containing protein [Anaerolineae bacterium]